MGVIKRIEIRNFRSIHHLIIDQELNNINLLVGNNDIGKSNILRALNLFFNGQTDLGKPLDFWEDFNKNLTRTSGKGQYIKVILDIELKYEKDKYVRWTKYWNNLGNLKKIDDYQVFDSNTHESTDFEYNTRAKGWLDRIVFRYVPAIKSERYFQHLYEELHDLLSSTYSKKFQSNTTALIQSIQEITEDITTELNEEISLRNKISLPSDLKAFFGALDFSLDINGQKFNLKGRGDGIKVRHIPIVLRFLANKAKVFKRGAIDVKTIWGFEEPENNLEMGQAFQMAKSFLKYSDKIDIFITTHSPAFYSLKDTKQTSCWFVDRNDTNSTIVINTNKEDIDLDEKMGVLWYITPFIKTKDEEKERLETEISQISDSTKALVFTEDESDDLEMIKTYFRLHGFKDEYTSYYSYYGKDNFHAALVSADIMKKKNPQIKHCFFHRDMDVDGEYFNTKMTPRLTKKGRKSYHLVMPKGYDLESEFINADHIHSLYNSISPARVTELIDEATDEKKETSLKKLRETHMAVETSKQLKAGVSPKDFKWSEMIKKVDSMYEANPVRYRYGKKVLGVLKAKLQHELGQNIEPIQETEFVIRPELKSISNKLNEIKSS